MVPQLVAEQRRHWRMSFGLMLGFLVSGIAVSNERGVFVPLHDLANSLAITARAFAALAAPPGRTQLQPYENLLLSSAPGLPAQPGQDEPQAMIARVLDTPPEQAGQPPFTPFLSGPAPIGDLTPTPIDTPTGPDTPALAPLPPTISLSPNMPVLTMPEAPPLTAPVPEPSSWALLIAGFGAIGWLQRRVARAARRASAV